jgi:hypothetical protein
VPRNRWHDCSTATKGAIILNGFLYLDLNHWASWISPRNAPSGWGRGWIGKLETPCRLYQNYRHGHLSDPVSGAHGIDSNQYITVRYRTRDGKANLVFAKGGWYFIDRACRGGNSIAPHKIWSVHPTPYPPGSHLSYPPNFRFTRHVG